MTELDEKAKEARREYYRQYRQRNPQKIKETNARYWQRRAAKMAAENGGADGTGKTVEQREAGADAETQRV